MNVYELTLEQVKELFPDRPLLPIKRCDKRPIAANWQKTTFEQTQLAWYQANLQSFPNTGVLLGGGWAAYDCDTDEGVEEFFNLNPKLRGNTLVTKGARGAQIWLRPSGEYPQKCITVPGRGEWRGGNCQSVVRGIHPNGNAYTCLCNKPPIEVAFSNLRFPDWMAEAIAQDKAPATPTIAANNGARPPAASIDPISDKRIRGYLDTVERAVMGKGGSIPTFRVTCFLANDCALSRDDALIYLRYYSEIRCDPPWSEKELNHKLDDAFGPNHYNPTGSFWEQRPLATVLKNVRATIEPKTSTEPLAYEPGCEETPPPFAAALKDDFSTEAAVHEPAINLEKETQAEFDRYLGETTPFPRPMREEAFDGLAGEIVAQMLNHCEASRETLLVQCLVMIGNIVGRSAYVYAGGPYLFPNEYVVCVGRTARGRKGTALKMNEHLFELVRPEWVKDCTGSGFQTGEGILHRIRDERRGIRQLDRRRKQTRDEPPIEEVIDPGVSDKRIMIVEEEFSHTLKMAQRSGNSLTEVLRRAWDSPRILEATNKNSPSKSTDSHVSLIAHATREELLGTMKAVDLSNGFANRILWVAAERRQLMPDAQFLDWSRYPEITARLDTVFKQRFANTDEPDRFNRTAAAGTLWKEIYRSLDDEKGAGFLDAVTVRDTSHILKLAMIYAIIDLSHEIYPQHLKAALAVVHFCQESTRWIFAQSTGNKLANNILAALLRRPEGVTRGDITSGVCYRNTPQNQIDEALAILAKSKLAKMTLEIGQNKKKTQRWFALRGT